MVRRVINCINEYKAGKHDGRIKLSSNENPYPPPVEVIDTLKEALNSVNRYPDSKYGELKMAISEYLNVDVDEIFLGNGISDCIANICNAVIEPLDRVTIPVPSYTMYVMYSMLREASLNLPNYPYYRIDFDDFVRYRDSKLTFLCSPNNPTGNVIDLKDLRYVLESFKGYVVLDEAYVEFSKGSAIKLVEDYENLVILRTFSKYFGLAGLRVGYGICKDYEFVSALEKIRLPFCINNLAVFACKTALRCLDYYEKIKRMIVVERKRLYKELSKFEGLEVFPSEANFILVRVKDNLKLAERLEEKGILVRDLTGLMGLEGEHVRITVGRKEENDALLNALREILT